MPYQPVFRYSGFVLPIAEFRPGIENMLDRFGCFSINSELFLICTIFCKSGPQIMVPGLVHDHLHQIAR